jgi:transcriptional regulator GlxA family with amidase domain
VEEISESAKGYPFFPSPIILDRDLANRFSKLHAALEGTASDLERDSHLLSVLTQFVLRHADAPSSPNPVRRERGAVKLVREYLEDNYAENVSLEQLARLASLSTFHLARVFAQEVGLPPHAYQLGVRLARAKGLLLRGRPVAQTAFETGFADQSHLTRHFKRLVGIPPGRYAQNSKNVQYSSL